MNVYVGGVNGVGKSTILRRVTQQDQSFEVIHFASALMQELGLGPGDYDALHDTAKETSEAAMAKIINALVERQTTKIRLIDGHYLNTIWGHIKPIATDWIAGMDAAILITAQPSVVWRRIEQDEAYRDRELFPKGMKDKDAKVFLADYIGQTEHYFDQLVNKYDLEHFMLEHSSDDAERAAQQIITFCKALKP